MTAFSQVIFIVLSVLSQAFSLGCELTLRSKHGYALVGHVYKSFTADRLAFCYSACNTRPDCQSLNYNLADKTCQFNNETHRSNPEKLKPVDVLVYAENLDRTLLGSVSTRAAKSCQHIYNVGDATGNGAYWIDPEGSGNSFKAFCDMTTDGGGWLMVANLVLVSSALPPNWDRASSSYRGITDHATNTMGLTASAMKQLRAHIQFSQIRFHCSKKKGTAIHLKSTLDSKGEAVVKYFSGETNVLPGSCNSFIRMEGDTSRLTTQCDKWGNDGAQYVGKWGHYQRMGENRLLSYAAFVAHKYHWIASSWYCDDGEGTE